MWPISSLSVLGRGRTYGDCLSRGPQFVCGGHLTLVPLYGLVPLTRTPVSASSASWALLQTTRKRFEPLAKKVCSRLCVSNKFSHFRQKAAASPPSTGLRSAPSSEQPWAFPADGFPRVSHQWFIPNARIPRVKTLRSLLPHIQSQQNLRLYGTSARCYSYASGSAARH